jgi:hypothetical protein
MFGPAAETFLTIVLIAAVVLGALAYLGRPVWRRIWLFLKGWYEADRLHEENLKQQAAFRAQAAREIDEITEATRLTETSSAPDGAPPAPAVPLRPTSMEQTEEQSVKRN